MLGNPVPSMKHSVGPSRSFIVSPFAQVRNVELMCEQIILRFLDEERERTAAQHSH